MKSLRDLYSFRIDSNRLHIIRFIEFPFHELFIGGKYLAGDISTARKFYVPCNNSHKVVVAFNLIDWNLVWEQNKVYNFYYSIPFKDRRRYYK